MTDNQRPSTITEDASPAARGDERSTRGRWLWYLWFALAGVGAWIWVLPASRAFNLYAFGDAGATMRLPLLGQRLGAPTLAFAYNYGILSHALAVMGLNWFGDTPSLFIVAGLFSQVGMFLAAAFLGAGLGLGKRGMAVLLGLAPLWMLNPVTGLHYPMEMVLLVLALGWHARGRLPAALSACVLAALFRPSLALLYGLALLIALWQTQPAPRLRQWLRALLAPAAVGVGVMAVAAVCYPPRALVAMQVPLRVATFYRADGLGLLGLQGRAAWAPPGVHFAYYLGTPMGGWILASALLLAAAAWTLAHPGLLQSQPRTFLLGSVFLYFTAQVFLYGRGPNYGILLAAGLALMTTLRRRWVDATLALLVCAAVLGQYTSLRAFGPSWRQPSAAVFDGLHGPAEEAEEWGAIVSAAKQARVLVLTPTGAPELVSPPGIHGVAAWMLLPGLPLQPEMRQLRQEVAQADLVVLPILRSASLGTQDWAVIAAALGGFHPIATEQYFQVLARDP